MKSESSASRARGRCIHAAASALIIATGSQALADSIAGADTLVCSAGQVAVCASDGSCENTSTAHMGIPQFLIVDLKNKQMRTTVASGANRASDISTPVLESGRLHFQGSQGGRALSANISEQTGDGAFAIAVDNAIVAVFAACTPLPID